MQLIPPSSLNLQLVDGDTLYVDNTALETFTTCPRRALYSQILRYRTAGDRVALTFGGIIHKILETRYRKIAAGVTDAGFLSACMQVTAEEEFHGKLLPDGTTSKSWSPPENDHRNYSCAMEFIERYNEEYSFEDMTIVGTGTDTPMIEIPFALPLGEITRSDGKVIKIVWMGRIDLGYTTQSGGIYVMDHKTTSMMGPSYFAGFQLSHQFRGYEWAVEQLLGIPVSGTVVNALGIRKPTKTGKAFELKRQLFPAVRAHLVEWKVDCLHIISDFVEMALRRYLPKHTAWCQGKYGECEFFKVCTLDSEPQRQIMLSSGEYEPNIWNPLT